MAATLVSAPPDIAYNSNDIWVEIESDLVNTSAAGYFDLDISGSGPSVGQTLDLEFGSSTVALTVAASTNSSATAIPTKGGESLAEYAERVGDALRENASLSANFLISLEGLVGAAQRVRLTSRTQGEIDLEATSSLSSVVVTATDGTSPNTEPNLTCVVEVWKKGASFSEDERITTLHGTYRADTAATAFNLRELFAVAPHLPNENHITPGIFASWLRGEASQACTAYYLRFADKYGAPAAAEALLRSDSDYYVLHGADSADRAIFDTSLAHVRLLHNYRRADQLQFWKPLADGQPDWVYLYVPNTLTGCNVEWDVVWDDGTASNHPYTGTPFSLTGGKAYYIRSIPSSFGFTPPSTGLLPWYITFKMFGTPMEGGETDIVEVKYRAVPTTDWERFLFFDNGRGGCESVLFNGKGQESFAASRDIARRVRTQDFNLRDGELLSLNAEGAKEYDLNTGWIEPWYADHLRQLLLGDAWLLDKPNRRFARLLVETGSIEVHKDDQGLHALQVKFRSAWDEKAINL